MRKDNVGSLSVHYALVYVWEALYTLFHLILTNLIYTEQIVILILQRLQKITYKRPHRLVTEMALTLRLLS